MFALCAQKAGVTPKECLFIGDNYEKDVLGPRKYGMNAVCYGRYGKNPMRLSKECVISFEDCLKDNEIVIGTYKFES